MHIPDGYLSPATSGVLYAAVAPFWAVAARRLGRSLQGRMVPLLSMFAALTFAVMMFNVPVPGGTTAHAVGGTLVAIVLGPSAAVVGVSVALVLQAVFFGDGGILAIGANALNLGVALPLTGYLVYRLVAGTSGPLSRRRVIAAAAGGYAGISVAALLTGLELGIQPLLWTRDGHALYSPYGLDKTMPAMVISHLFGASIVEAAVTALGLSYLQRSFPDLVGARDGEALDEGRWRLAHPWPAAAGVVSGGVAVAALLGLATGDWRISHAFGLDWATVDWRAVALTIAVSAGMTILVAPVLYFAPALRKRPPLRAAAVVLAALVIWAPLGLIAPGGAFAEDLPAPGATTLNADVDYVPGGLRDLGAAQQHTPFAGYTLPWVAADAPAWQQDLACQGTAVAGLLLLGAFGAALYVLAARRPRRRPARGFVEKTIAEIAGNLERTIFTEEHARSDGFLQRVDPRVKLGAFALMVLGVGLATSPWVILALYAVTLAAALASRVPLDFFVRRVWLGVPLFSALVVAPSVFITGSDSLLSIPLGVATLDVHREGLIGAGILVLRVGSSVSLAVLLVLTTRWADILKSLRVLKVPAPFVLVLGMTYRYIFLLLHTVSGMFLSRQSRTVGRTAGGEQRRWAAASVGVLINRSYRMSNEVFQAMQARGFSGQVRTLSAWRVGAIDWALLAAAALVALNATLVDRWLLR